MAHGVIRNTVTQHTSTTQVQQQHSCITKIKHTKHMTTYENELQRLKDWDEVQHTVPCNGFEFIVTAGHGYLVVPNTSEHYALAKDVWESSGYGFIGTHAVYLEEDCEADTFLKKWAQVA